VNTDLFTACVFCASWLLSGNPPPAPSYSAELAAGYATLLRRDRSPGAVDAHGSDVTAKFTAVGFGHSREFPAELGAGTPDSEWRIRLSYPASHDEADQGAAAADSVVATGRGRYENFSGLWRQRLSARDSLEFEWEERRHKVTDLVNVGGSPFQFTGERDLVADRMDFLLGARHRWPGVEIAAAFDDAIVHSRYNTPLAIVSAEGHLLGATVEARVRRNAWTFSLAGNAVGGTLPVSASSAPDFASRRKDESAWMRSLTGTVSRELGTWRFLVSGFLDRTRLPFVSLAVLGAETHALDAGDRPLSRTREWGYEIAIRKRVAAGVWPEIFYRSTLGDEKVTFDGGSETPRTLSVDRGKIFPAYQFSVGAGVTLRP
jgi:hypothetical protein